MTWHPLDADKPKHPEAGALPSNRNADLSPQDVLEYLSGELTKEDIEHRRERVAYGEKIKTERTTTVLDRMDGARWYGWDDYYYRFEHEDLLREELRNRPHVPNRIEAKLLRRMNATKHHGSKEQRRKAIDALQAFRRQSPKYQAFLRARRIEMIDRNHRDQVERANRARRLGRDRLQSLHHFHEVNL